MHPRLAQLALTAALAGALTFMALAQDVPGLLGTYRIERTDPLLGGLSAIEMTEDGSEIVLLSDRGALFRGPVTRNADSGVASLVLEPAGILTARNGQRGTRGARDSEGLALDAQGNLFISYEGDHRVALHETAGDRSLPGAAGFSGLEANGSLEPLAIDDANTLYTLPEVSDGPNIPVFRYTGSAWQDNWTIPRLGSFRPVGADVEGSRFFLLERDFSLFRGFASRIRAFRITPDGMSGGEIVWQSRYGTFPNLEGLSLWHDAQGRLVASMVSDDNFSPLLPSLLVEIVLSP